MELLPCPFCGCESLSIGDYHGLFHVECDNINCGIEGRASFTEHDAEEAWNTRTQSWPPMQTGEPPEEGVYLALGENRVYPSIGEWFDGDWLFGRTPPKTVIGWWPLPPMGER